MTEDVSRIHFSAWGRAVNREEVTVPAYAMRARDGWRLIQTDEMTVAVSIARKSGLRVWGVPRLDGYANGVKAHWVTMLVDRNNSPLQVWFSINEGGGR